MIVRRPRSCLVACVLELRTWDERKEVLVNYEWKSDRMTASVNRRTLTHDTQLALDIHFRP